MLASAATFFGFNEPESAANTDSETSPIPSVSGRLPEDSTSSNYKKTTIASQNIYYKKAIHWIYYLMGLLSDITQI